MDDDDGTDLTIYPLEGYEIRSKGPDGLCLVLFWSRTEHERSQGHRRAVALGIRRDEANALGRALCDAAVAPDIPDPPTTARN